MSEENSGLFEQFTKNALKHGTPRFFQGGLACVLFFVLLRYTSDIPTEIRFNMQLVLQIAFCVAVIYSLFVMIFSEKISQAKLDVEEDRKVIPNLSLSPDEGLVSRYRDALERIQKPKDERSLE